MLCRMSRPCAVTSSASGRAKKREAENPRHPYLQLASSLKPLYKNVIQQALVRVMAITMGPIKGDVCTLCPYT